MEKKLKYLINHKIELISPFMFVFGTIGACVFFKNDNIFGLVMCIIIAVIGLCLMDLNGY